MNGPQDEPDPGRREAWEAAAVVLTAALFLVATLWLDLHAPFIAVALLGWGTWIGRCAAREPSRLALLGFTRQGLAPTTLAAAVVLVAGVAALALIGHSRGRLILLARMAPLFLLYPVWGLLQQLLVLGLVARPLSRTRTILSSPFIVAPVCAALFGLVHLPEVELTVGTAALGLCFAAIYLRWRNLWPLGLAHGWLGVFAYYWMLERDPFRELFG